MNYTEALERAKSTPVMRPKWKTVWLTYENDNWFLLHDSGAIISWKPYGIELLATDWIEAPKNKSITDPE